MVKSNKYGTESIQNELLDILKLFHDFCVKNEIKYSLYAGSCLGAVRHQGFIPWDDDLDVCMDRYNYNKLLSSFHECLGLGVQKTIWIDRIQKKNAVTVKNYIPTMDIFVIDSIPDNKLIFEIKVFLLSVLQGMLKEEVSYKKATLFHKILLFGTHIAGKFFSTSTLRRWYDSVSQIGNDNPSEFVHISNAAYAGIRRKIPADTWDEVQLTPFEDTCVYNTTKYDVFLKIRYGNYMELPDEKHRMPEHVKNT